MSEILIDFHRSLFEDPVQSENGKRFSHPYLYNFSICGKLIVHLLIFLLRNAAFLLKFLEPSH